MVEISTEKGDITEEKRADAIVNPANSLGMMGGGVAFAIKKKGGTEIENQAMKKAPISIGFAVATTAGKLPADYVIHTPTMERPAESINLENVKKATIAALKCASKLNINSIAFPGMGTGVGGVSKKDAAKIMINSIREFFSKETKTSLKKVILIGYDDELYQEFKRALEEEK